MTEAYCFRQRFELAPGGRLPFTGRIEVLSEANGSIELRSLEDAIIAESSKLAIWGSGYDSAAAAKAAGEHGRSAVQRALAGVGLGANFGLRNPDVGGLVDAELERRMRREEGVTVFRDSGDVLIFPCEPRPMFSSMVAEGYVTPMTWLYAHHSAQVARSLSPPTKSRSTSRPLPCEARTWRTCGSSCS